MSKKIFIILIVALFMLGVSNLSFAMMCHGQGDKQGSHEHAAQTSSEHPHGSTEATTQVIPQALTEEVENVGNKICPVSGEKINEDTKVTYEYEGKIYNFCCAMCIDEFKKDPDKYIKKIEQELKGTPEAKSKEDMMMPESGMMDMKDSDSQHYSN